MRSLASILFLIGALLSCFFIESQAQVNFSPTWGKRASVSSGVGVREVRDPVREMSDHFPLPVSMAECKVPFDGVARVLKLIQVEAQRLLKCEGIPSEGVE